MNEEFDREWDSRTAVYPGAAPLPATPAVHLTVTDEYASSVAGQIAALVATNLIGRMTKNFAFTVPDVTVDPRLPLAGRLREVLAATLEGLHPSGRYEFRVPRPDDFRITLGRKGPGLVAHGDGWNAFVGRGESPLPNVPGENPIGAAFSVILAASELQRGLLNDFRSVGMVNTFDWSSGRLSARNDDVLGAALGDIWIVGLGSVGSSAAYFLALLSREWSPTLIDGDEVKIANVTRSPVFRTSHAGRAKVEVVRKQLEAFGLNDITVHARWFNELNDVWMGRPVGTPDVVVAAANERAVRSQIEAGFPPLQIYATTGSSWQATLLRHIPMIEACSRCIPGLEVVESPPLCATDAYAGGRTEQEPRVDAALSPLSFAAGLMTAAEIMKCSLEGYPFSSNRVFFEMRGDRPLRSVTLGRRSGCICETRDAAIHRATVAGSRYAQLSKRVGFIR